MRHTRDYRYVSIGSFLLIDKKDGESAIEFVSIHDIVKRFGQTIVLENLSFGVNEGERLVILGPSGCGKTTTLRLIAGLEQLDGGEIRIDGKVVSKNRTTIPPDKRNIGMVFQDLALWPHMTVGENVEFVLRAKLLSRSERQFQVLETLKLVKMDSRINSYPQELSGGEQQRVAIARALVSQPKVLLMDEPLSNLDAHLREKLGQEICRIQRELGLTLLYVTHDQEDAMSIADRVAVMNNGRLEQIGTPEDIYHNPRTRFVAGFVGLMNIIEGQIVSPGIVETSIGRISCNIPFSANLVTLAFRPELIGITDNGQIRGVVTGKIFKGHRTLYTISVRETLLTVCTSDSINLKDNVGLRFNRQPIVFIE